MKKILCLALSIFAITSLTACDLSREYIYSGDFEYTTYYSNVRGETVAAITGISAQGKTKDTLIFPNIIDGYEVYSIGFNYYANPTPPIEIVNATKIYFPNTIARGESMINYNPIVPEKYINVFFPSFPRESITESIYYNLENLENYNLYDHNKYIEYGYSYLNYTPANITYYVEIGIDIDEDKWAYYDSVYFIDDVDGELIVNIPPTPIKEGYEFAGWYKDIEYTQTWDFNNDKVPSKEYDEEGNYLFNETALYAKWIEIIE